MAGGFLYYAQYSSGDVGRCTTTGASNNATFATTSLGSSTICGVAVDSNYIYMGNYGSAGGVYRAPIAGGAASLLFATSNPVFSLAVDSTYVYYAMPAATHIGRATIAGGSINNTFITPNGEPLGVAVN